MGLELKADTPTDIADLYGRLWQEIASLHGEWQLYRQVYARQQEDLDVLNTTAGHLFFVVHNIWVRDILRAIGCLTDKPTMAGRSNLSLSALVMTIDPYSRDSELQDGLKRLNELSGFARDHRNRNIAHYDRDTRGKVPENPLAEFSRMDIEAVLGAMSDILNAVSVRYGGTPTVFTPVANLRSQGDSLLKVLKAGLEKLRS